MPEIPRQIDEPQERSPIIFRDLRLEDCDDMVEVINSIVDEGAPISRKEKTNRVQWLPKLKSNLQKIEKKEDVCIVAEMDEHCVGWISCRKFPDENGIPTACIGTLMMAAKARGKPSMELLEKGIEKTQETWGTKKVKLYTSVNNMFARKLYKKNGFKETGKVLKEEGPDDYIELEKNLE